MLVVNSSHSRLTKMQDERAYSLMIEDFCRQVLRRKNFWMMALVPTMMHAGFISPKTFEAMCKSLERLAADEKISEGDREFISKHCIETVKAKWADRNRIKKEVPVIFEEPQVVKEEILPPSEPSEEVFIIDTTKAGIKKIEE